MKIPSLPVPSSKTRRWERRTRTTTSRWFFHLPPRYWLEGRIEDDIDVEYTPGHIITIVIVIVTIIVRS